MVSEQACVDALREAARELGASPSKAEYEALGLTPASATVIRTLGGWNDAKEAAGLSTTAFESAGNSYRSTSAGTTGIGSGTRNGRWSDGRSYESG